MEEFKAELDQFLARVPDEPKVNGGTYIPGACDAFSEQPLNSMIDQIRQNSNVFFKLTFVVFLC